VSRLSHTQLTRATYYSSYYVPDELPILAAEIVAVTPQQRQSKGGEGKDTVALFLHCRRDLRRRSGKSSRRLPTVRSAAQYTRLAFGLATATTIRAAAASRMQPRPRPPAAAGRPTRRRSRKGSSNEDKRRGRAHAQQHQEGAQQRCEEFHRSHPSASSSFTHGGWPRMGWALGHLARTAGWQRACKGEKGKQKQQQRTKTLQSPWSKSWKSLSG
jgi:hypothetical protein